MPVSAVPTSTNCWDRLGFGILVNRRNKGFPKPRHPILNPLPTRDAHLQHMRSYSYPASYPLPIPVRVKKLSVSFPYCFSSCEYLLCCTISAPYAISYHTGRDKRVTNHTEREYSCQTLYNITIISRQAVLCSFSADYCLVFYRYLASGPSASSSLPLLHAFDLILRRANLDNRL